MPKPQLDPLPSSYLAARVQEADGIFSNNLVGVVEGNKLVEGREELAVANDLVLAVRRLVDHVVLDAATSLYAFGKIMKGRSGDERTTRGYQSQATAQDKARPVPLSYS